MTKRISIAGLMGFVLFAALGFAGLKGASEAWASSCFTLLAVALVVAPLNAWQGRGKGRAYWGGFAAAAWIDCLIVFGPMGPARVNPPPLATAALSDRLEGLIHPSPFFTVTSLVTYQPVPVAPSPPLPPGAMIIGPVAPPPPGPTINSTISYTPLPTTRMFRGSAAPFDHDSFQQVAHALAALMAGMVGGLYSAWLFVRRERRERQPPTDPARPADLGPADLGPLP